MSTVTIDPQATLQSWSFITTRHADNQEVAFGFSRHKSGRLTTVLSEVGHLSARCVVADHRTTPTPPAARFSPTLGFCVVVPGTQTRFSRGFRLMKSAGFSRFPTRQWRRRGSRRVVPCGCGPGSRRPPWEPLRAVG